jgi:GNAT superfamily N-acetyltransferase
MRVRYADSKDDAVMIAMLGCAMHAESSFAPMPYDMFDAKAFAEWVMADPTQVAILLEDDAGEPVGMALCGVSRSFFGPAKNAYEHLFYVVPGHRRSGAALLLRDAYVEWAKAQGAQRIGAGNSAGAFDEHFVKLWTGGGFERAGSIMYKYL